MHAIDAILHQKTQTMDLMTVKLCGTAEKDGSDREVMSFCVVSWGLHARYVSQCIFMYFGSWTGPFLIQNT
jgi:hypothetical protein